MVTFYNGEADKKKNKAHYINIADQNGMVWLE